MKNLKRKTAQDDDSDEAGKKFYDETGKFHWSGESSSDSEQEEKPSDRKEKEKKLKKQHAKKAKKKE